MKPCRAHTRKQEPCTKRALPGSRYCFFHQDPGTWFFGTLLGILLALAQTWYQGASPFIQVQCDPTTDEDPSRLDCHISNTGRAEARDVIVGFNHLLPLDTKVSAAPELAITLFESPTPPDPTAHPIAAANDLAFSIKAPRIASHDKVSFQLYTSHEDNRRAAEQLMRIRTVQKAILKDFTADLVSKFPNESKDWNLEVLNAFHAVDGNFFRPGRFSYEHGRFPVRRLSEEQEKAKAKDDELYERFKPKLIKAWKDRPAFLSPVVRIRTSKGNSTYAIYPADVETCVDMVVRVSDLTIAGRLAIYPPVPTNYQKQNACS